jgi:zinc protease
MHATRGLFLVVFALGMLAVSNTAGRASTAVERVVSPGGIEVWLVREPSVPLIAIDFAFRGGSCQVSPEKAGLADLVTDLLDEGAGDLDSRAFHERVENYAIGLSFSASRDYVGGSLHTLTENQDVAFDLLRMALTQPRFDADVVERVRTQVLSGLKRANMNPNDLANRNWWAKAFPGHPYAQPVSGTLETVPNLTVADLKGYVRRTFARDNLKVGIVGNVDAEAAGRIVDRIFGGLPAKAELKEIPNAEPTALGKTLKVELDVPQSVVLVGGHGLSQKDPDFMAAYVLNHILGGGSFSSRLYREVREVRGLAYSVHSTLMPLDHAALFVAGTATRTDRADEALSVMQNEIRRMAESGPTVDELAAAKSYLKGSYALRFDTSSKIASQLVMLQLADLGIDYFTRRNSLVDAVTLDDVKRVARRLLSPEMLVAVVGRGTSVAGTGSAPAPATEPAAIPAPAAVPASVPVHRDGG